MYYPHRQCYHKSNHNQTPTAQPPVWLGHYTDKVEPECDDMVNHRSPKITIALSHLVNGF
jgi:hypothetical protein